MSITQSPLLSFPLAFVCFHLSIIWIDPSFLEDRDRSATRDDEMKISQHYTVRNNSVYSHHEIVRCVHSFAESQRVHWFRHIGAEPVHAIVEEVRRVWDRHRQSAVATFLSRVISHSWQEWVLTNLMCRWSPEDRKFTRYRGKVIRLGHETPTSKKKKNTTNITTTAE